MPTVAHLNALITADTRSFEASLKRSGTALTDFSRAIRSQMQAASQAASAALQSFGRTASSVGSALSLSVTAPALALGRAVVRSAVEMESLQKGLLAVTGSAQATHLQLRRLEEVAKLPGLGFKEAIQASINLQAAGMSATLAERSLRAFGNALATVGKGKAELDGVTLALTQIQTMGKVTAEEINQIQQRVPQIRKIMLEAFGTADTNVLAKAKITSEQFFQAILPYFERLPQMTSGAKNALENFSDSMDKAMTRLGNTVLPTLTRALPVMESTLTGFTREFAKLSPSMKDSIVQIATFAAVVGPASFAIGQVTLAVRGLGLAMAALAGPTGVVLAAGAGLLYLAHSYREATAQGAQAMAQAANYPQIVNVYMERIRQLEQRLKDPAFMKMTLPGTADRYVAELNGLYEKARQSLAQWRLLEAPKIPLPEIPKIDTAALRKQIADALNAASIKEAKKAAEAVQNYLLTLQQEAFTLAHVGKVAEVQWERMHGVLLKATASQYGQALAIARSLDVQTALSRVQETYRETVQSLQAQLKLGANATERQRMEYRLMAGDLAGVTTAQKDFLRQLSTQIAVQQNAKLAQEQRAAFWKHWLPPVSVFAEAFQELTAQRELMGQIGLEGAFSLASMAQATATARKEQERFGQAWTQTTQSIAEYTRQLTLGENATEFAKVTFEQMNGPLAEAARQGNMAASSLLFLQGVLARSVDLTRQMAEATQSWGGLEQQIAAQVEASRLRLQAALDPLGEHYGKFLSGFKKALAGMNASVRDLALDRLRDAFATIQQNDREARSLTGFRKALGDIQQKIAELSGTNGFARFTAQFLQMEEATERLVQPFSEGQLRQLFQATESLRFLQEWNERVEQVAKDTSALLVQSFSNGFRTITTDFRQMLQRMAAEYLSSQLYRLLLRNLVGVFGRAFGGAKVGIGSAFSAEARAGGGPVAMGRAYLVGEQGPEVFVPRQSGAIVSNRELAGAGAVNVTINITTPDVGGFQRSQGQIASELARQLEHYRRRNG